MEDKNFQSQPVPSRPNEPQLPTEMTADEWTADLGAEIRDLERLIAEYNAIQDLKCQLASASSNRR